MFGKNQFGSLASTILPKNCHKICYYSGLCHCKPEYAIQLATLLRFNLVRVSQVLLSHENKDKKLEALSPDTLLDRNSFKNLSSDGNFQYDSKISGDRSPYFS